MAIIESLGLAVSVVIDGTPVAEYDDPEVGQRQELEFGSAKAVTKYIESRDDTEYAIRVEALPTHRWLPSNRDHLLTMYIYIDGKYQRSKAIEATSWGPDGVVSKTITGVLTRTSGSHGTLANFRFQCCQPK